MATGMATVTATESILKKNLRFINALKVCLGLANTLHLPIAKSATSSKKGSAFFI